MRLAVLSYFQSTGKKIFKEEENRDRTYKGTVERKKERKKDRKIERVKSM
jgi:hypothetical protein